MPHLQLHETLFLGVHETGSRPDRPELLLWWEAREPAQSDDAGRLSRFVSGLPDFDPIYWSWLESPETEKEVVSVPLSEAEARQVLNDGIARYDVGDRPWPELGSFIAAGHAGPPPYDFRQASTAGIHCHLGSSIQRSGDTANFIFMRLSNVRPSTRRPWRASELRPLMRFAREVWRPAEMCARFSFCDHPKIADPTWAAGERTLKPWIGWITYLPAHLASRADYPHDVELETFEDGAALVTLCEEPFGKDDAEGLARLRALEAALRPIQS